MAQSICYLQILFITEEKYKLAKQLKDCIAELQQVTCSHDNHVDNVTIKVGEEIAGYEVQKKEAIQREDYNLAEEKRSQSEMCQQQTFKRLGLSALLTESDALMLDESISPPVKVQDTVVELQPIKAQDDPKVLHGVADSYQQYDNQDERPLPTLDKYICTSIVL